jgi:tRNA threonylcarbamoyladenosine biosynthesis protein TsaB
MDVILAFDCAVAGLSVAVVREVRRLAGRTESGREQSARLLPAIDSVVREAAVAPRDLTLIAVTVGPGSFTGVRVGLAAAHGLALGLGIPLAGLATTSVLLAQAPADPRLGVAVIDSRLGDWFCALQDEALQDGPLRDGPLQDGPLQDEPQPFLVSAQGLEERLQGRPSLLIGSGVGPLADRLTQAGADAVGHEALPDAVVLARLAAADGTTRWRERNRRDGLPRPLYLRGVNITLPDGARRTVE